MSLKILHHLFRRTTVLAVVSLIPAILQARTFDFDKYFDSDHITAYVVAGPQETAGETEHTTFPYHADRKVTYVDL